MAIHSIRCFTISLPVMAFSTLLSLLIALDCLAAEAGAVLSLPVRTQLIQTQGAVVSGRVTEVQGSPLPGVIVVLFSLPDSTSVGGTATDANGTYLFREVAAGTYFMTISAIGMEKVNSSPFTVNGSGQAVTLPDITLAEDIYSLGEIVVKGEKDALEVKEGKLIFNIDRQLAAAGNSAFELLQRTPGVTVSGEDNLLLKGNANVNVMIDGKMTNLSPDQVSNLLKSTPAENISSIEIISAPSSQYDATGNAGIINIITKKSSEPGYALDLSSGIGTGRYPQTTQALTGNIQTGKWNVFGNYSYRYKHDFLSRTSYRIIGNGEETTIFDRASFDPSISHSHNYRAGVEYAMGKKQEIGFVYSGLYNKWSRDADGPTGIIYENSGLREVVRNQNITRELNRSQLFNLNYKLILDTLGRQLSVDGDYAGYSNSSRGSLGTRLFDEEGTPLEPYQELSFLQPVAIAIRSFRSDLVYPFKKNKFSTGVKYSSVTSDNNFRYDSLINNTYVYSSLLSNYFIYREQIFAAYLSGGRQFGKTSLDAGLRVERTLSEGNSITLSSVTRRDYTNLFPYISIGRQMGKNHQANVSLTRRINRPLYGNLNPARYFFDKFSYYEGNPFLQPETSWNAAASYTYLNMYVLTAGHIRTQNPISSFAQQNNETGELVVTTFNFSYRSDYNAMLIVPLQVAGFWQMQHTADFRYLTYALLQGNEVFNPERFTVDLSSSHTFELPWQSKLEVAAHYTSPSLSGVYVLRPFFTVDGGWRKAFPQKNLDIRLSFTDLFNTIRYWGYSIYEGANVSYNHRGDNRRINLSLTWHLGGKANTGKSRKLEETERVN